MPPGDVLSAVVQWAGGVMRLSPEPFRQALNAPGGWLPALIILLLGGLSEGIGHSVVLFANRVRPRRFVISLLLGTLVQTLVALVWALAIGLTEWIVGGGRAPLEQLFIVIALSYAPRLWGFATLLPYLGQGLQRLLNVWVALALLLGVGVAYRMTFWQALAPVLLGWALLEGLTRVPFLRAKFLDDWLWKASTGAEARSRIEKMADEFARRLYERTDRRDGLDR